MLRDIGIGQAEALRTITSVAAGVIGLGHRKGRIAPGFDADILAVDGDPIADPEALHRIRAVYARGTVVPDAGVPDASVSPRPGISVIRSSAVSMPLRQTERAMILPGSTRSR